MDFYRFWTSKESLVKYVGFGIDRDLKLIPALPLNGPKEYVGKKAYALNFVYDNNYTISVTTENKQDYELIVEHADGLLQ
jgi:phosphopantetheinyl transferase